MQVLLFRVPAEGIFRERSDAERLDSVALELRRKGMHAKVEASADPEVLRAAARGSAPDLAFSSSAYFPDGGSIHGLFEELGLPYVGSSPETIERCLDKAKLKERWKERGLPTPGWTIALPAGTGGFELTSSLPPFPLIMKPLAGGNSAGINPASVLVDAKDLESRLPAYLSTHGPSLLEAYLGLEPDLREFTLAMIGNPEETEPLPIEIRLAGQREFPMVTDDDKDRHRTIIQTVPRDGIRKDLLDLSKRAFLAAEVRDYARLDLLYARGGFHLIEINGQPMIPDRWFRECAADGGREDSYVSDIFTAALARAGKRGVAPGKGPS